MELKLLTNKMFSRFQGTDKEMLFRGYCKLNINE